MAISHSSCFRAANVRSPPSLSLIRLMLHLALGSASGCLTSSDVFAQDTCLLNSGLLSHGHVASGEETRGLLGTLYTKRSTKVEFGLISVICISGISSKYPFRLVRHH